MPTERTPGLPPLQLNVSRWSQLFRKLGVVKGDDIVSEVHRQIFPVIVVEDDRPEHKLLAGEALAAGQILKAAAGAGVSGFVGLRNPVASGKIVVLERATAIAGGLANDSMSRIYGELSRGATWTQASTEQPRDTRLQPVGAFGVGAPQIVGQVVSGQSDTIVVTPFVICEMLTSSNTLATAVGWTIAEWNSPLVLGPGDTFSMSLSNALGGRTANVAIQGSFWWRERATEPGETA